MQIQITYCNVYLSIYMIFKERNIKMELFADPKPENYTNTATTNLTQPTTATKSMDLSKYQPVRMRLAMPDMEPVAALRNKARVYIFQTIIFPLPLIILPPRIYLPLVLVMTEKIGVGKSIHVLSSS